jgi:hypothetical protein
LNVLRTAATAASSAACGVRLQLQLSRAVPGQPPRLCSSTPCPHGHATNEPISVLSKSTRLTIIGTFPSQFESEEA